MKFLELLYYRYYKFQQKVGNGGIAPFSSALFISFILYIYVIDLFVLSNLLWGINLPRLSWEYILGFQLILLCIVLLLFVFKGKYKRIISNHKEINSMHGVLAAILFPAIAIVVFFLGIYYKMLLNQQDLAGGKLVAYLLSS